MGAFPRGKEPSSLARAQQLPALQGLQQFGVDVGMAGLQRGHGLWLLRVQRRVGQACGQGCLLGFQGFDAAGQRVEFALLLVAELARGGGARAGGRGGG